jgi:hypothetical protein
MRVGSSPDALEREHARGERELTGHVLAQQPLEQIALVAVLRQRDLGQPNTLRTAGSTSPSSSSIAPRMR